MKIITTNWTKSQLKNIYSYYRDHAGIIIARKIKLQLLNRLKELISNPEMGQREEAFYHVNLGHRYLVEGHFKIVYRVEGDRIYITDIFDTRQHPGKMKP